MFFRWLIGVLWLAFFIWALVDIINARRDFGWKMLWAIVCLVFPFLGVLAYYFLGRPASGQSSPPPAN